MQDLAPVLVAITLFLTIGAVLRAHIQSRRLRENARLWSELQGKVIDRFGSATEVVRYLESSAGQKMLEGQAAAPTSPHTRILDSVHLGLLISVGGLGLVLAAPVTNREAAEVFRTVGMVGGLLGLGYLASAMVSWLLLKRWGVLTSTPVSSPTEAGDSGT